MVEHRKPVPRSLVDKILRPLQTPEETVIREFVPVDELFAILNSEGEPFTVLNQGFRELMTRRGISYDLEGVAAPLRASGPVRITRTAFFLGKGRKRSYFLIAETDSYLSDIDEDQHDPRVGDIRIFNLAKKNQRNCEPFINSEDVCGALDPHIILTRRNLGEKQSEFGHAVVSGYYGPLEIYNGEEALNRLKDMAWVPR